MELRRGKFCCPQPEYLRMAPLACPGNNGPSYLRDLLLVSPPSQECFDGSFFLQHLVNQTVLDVDPSRVGAVKVTHEFLETRRCS